MGKVVLVRHGETDWNKVDRIQGWTDVPLNSEGVKQADRTAKKLSRLKIAAFYSSPLSRALKTAEKIADKNKKQVTIVDDFIEINQGLWEGLLVDEAKKQFPSLYQKWQNNPYDTCPPGGESVKHLATRVLPAFERIKADHQDETVCVVTHKMVMALIACAHKGLDLKSVRRYLPGNAEWEILKHGNIDNPLQQPSGGGGSRKGN